MPETPGGSGSGRIDWESDWSGDVPATGPTPELEEEPAPLEDTDTETQPDTPELTFLAPHAAFPGTVPSVQVVGEKLIDYSEAWLSELEIEALGDITGLRVLNPMAGTGEDAIALARLGASVVAANLEEGAAREHAAGEGLDIDFTSVHEQVLPMELRSGEFDVVYVGPDSLPWIEDLDDWAWSLADALAPGGRLVIHDEHPITYVFASVDGQLVVARSYFEGEVMAPDADEDDEPLSLAREESWTPEETERTNFGWTLGDLVTAFGEHGVATTRLEEMPASQRFFSALDALPDIYEEDLDRVPGAFLLLGTKLRHRDRG